MNIPNCPRCNSNAKSRKQEDKLFICGRCNMQYDGIDDGDVGYGSQERYAERKEEYLARQKQRLLNRYSGRKPR